MAPTTGILITGATGYIGSYVVHSLLADHPDPLFLLVRAGSHDEALRRLWRALQLHMDAASFLAATRDRVSRFPETTQFDMVRAFALLARLPLLPLAPDWRLDIVPADFVGRAIAAVHQLERPRHDAYNLSAGTGSPTYREIALALAAAGRRWRPFFAPRLYGLFAAGAAGLAETPRAWGLSRGAARLKVFLPYLEGDLVFDNRRIVEQLGQRPASFVGYAHALLRFAERGGFAYPYRPWPGQDLDRGRNPVGRQIGPTTT